jgi:hypothetical protein
MQNVILYFFCEKEDILSIKQYILPYYRLNFKEKKITVILRIPLINKVSHEENK